MLTLACLPYEGFYSLSAVARTTVRLLVTRRRLLEWTPSAHRGASTRHDLAGEWARMWIAPALAGAALLLAVLAFHRWHAGRPLGGLLFVAACWALFEVDDVVFWPTVVVLLAVAAWSSWPRCPTRTVPSR